MKDLGGVNPPGIIKMNLFFMRIVISIYFNHGMFSDGSRYILHHHYWSYLYRTKPVRYSFIMSIMYSRILFI